MLNITNYLSSFEPLLSFEPKHDEKSIAEAKKKFSNMTNKKSSLEDIYNSFQEFPLFLNSIIAYDVQTGHQSRRHPATL